MSETTDAAGASPAAMTLDDVRSEIRRLDPNLDEQSDHFKTAVLLLSALVLRPAVQPLMEFTGFPESFVGPRMRRLREAGVVVNDPRRKGTTKALAVDWDNPQHGTIAFWMDVLAAEGLVQRARN